MSIKPLKTCQKALFMSSSKKPAKDYNVALAVSMMKLFLQRDSIMIIIILIIIKH